MNKSLKVKITVGLFIILIIFLICNKLLTKKEIEKNVEIQTASLFQEINLSSTAKINKYII